MLSASNGKAFAAFYDAVRDESVLDRKTTILVGLAAALTAGCAPWVEHYLGVAKENNISEAEVGAVQGLCMAVSAGRVNAQLKDVEKRLRNSAGAAE